MGSFALNPGYNRAAERVDLSEAPQSDLLQPLPGGSLAAETVRSGSERATSANSSAGIDQRQGLWVGLSAAPAVESLSEWIIRVVRRQREQRHGGPDTRRLYRSS
jgi:hypothetical protein